MKKKAFIKEHNIPVRIFYSTPRYYITHPGAFFRDIRDAYRNYYARAKRGFAWVDLWNLDKYLGTMVPNALDELADRSCGAPYGPEECYRWKTFEEWQQELHLLAKLMRIANTEYLVHDEFGNKFHEWRSGLILQPIRHTSFYSEYVIPNTDADAIDAATSELDQYYLQVKSLRKVIFNVFAEIWDSLWD